MTDPVFRDVEDVLLIHEEQLPRYGGADGIRDRALLESAVAMPRATAGGEFAHEDVYGGDPWRPWPRRRGSVVSVMNDTKWDELRLAMYELGASSPRWRTKTLGSGYVCAWDGEWFYHFRGDGYADIEWVEIKITSPTQRTDVLTALRRVHVPGHETEDGFRVYGYVKEGEHLEYL